VNKSIKQKRSPGKTFISKSGKVFVWTKYIVWNGNKLKITWRLVTPEEYIKAGLL